MTVEDDPEEVVRLAFMPVIGRVDPDDRRNMRIGIRHRYFQPDSAVVRDRSKWIHGVQFTTGVLRVVHSVDTQAELEAKIRFVAQSARNLRQVGAFDVQRHLVSKDHYSLDCIGESATRAAQCRVQGIRDCIEISAERSRSLVL